MPLFFRNTELECGQLSSCSDSEESCSEEALDLVLNSSGVVGAAAMVDRAPSSELNMNDVDEETMSGENDVSFAHNNPPPSMPALSTSDLDSLTYTEPSLESLTSLTMTAKSSAGPQQAASTNFSMEENMLLLRLMDSKGQPGEQPSRGGQGQRPGIRSSLPAKFSHNLPRAPRAANTTQLFDSLQLDFSTADPFVSRPQPQAANVNVSNAAKDGQQQVNDPVIAPLPSLGAASSADVVGLSQSSSLASTPTTATPPIQTLVQDGGLQQQLTRMPSLHAPSNAGASSTSNEQKESSKDQGKPSTPLQSMVTQHFKNILG